jgi:hypothetical protein
MYKTKIIKLAKMSFVKDKLKFTTNYPQTKYVGKKSVNLPMKGGHE